MYLYGENFLKNWISLWCAIDDKIANTNAIWKWDGKIGFNIPDMGAEIPIGEHVCTV